MMVVQVARQFVDREKSIVILWIPGDRQKWQQTDRKPRLGLKSRIVDCPG